MSQVRTTPTTSARRPRRRTLVALAGATSVAALAGVGLTAPAAHAAAASPSSAQVTSLQQRIVNLAYEQEGQTNANGQYGPAGQEWCAWFATWDWNQVDANLPRFGNAGAAYEYGQSHGTLHSSPKVGDFVVYGYTGNGYAAHVGIVLKVKGPDDIDEMDGNFGPGTSHVAKELDKHPSQGESGNSGAQLSGYVSAFPDAD